jgi:hypothetical protein
MFKIFLFSDPPLMAPPSAVTNREGGKDSKVEEKSKKRTPFRPKTFDNILFDGSAPDPTES